MLHVCLGQPQQHYNDVWTLLPHFPLFSRTHLVKPGAADRTAGLLMITFSRCPIVCILWPFPLKNSRWTATAPSQMPFLHLLMPRQPLESQTSLSKEERGEKGYFIWLWVLKLAVSLFEVYHFCILFFFHNLFRLLFLLISCRGVSCVCFYRCSLYFTIQYTNMGQHVPGMKTQNWLHLDKHSSYAIIKYCLESPSST